MRLRRACLALVVVLLAANGAPGGQGRRGALTLRILGRPAPAKTLREVALIDASTGEVLRAAGTTRKRQLVLRPDPGVLFAVAADAGVRGARDGVSRVFRVDPSVAATAAIRPRRPVAAAAQRGARAARAAGGVTATMGPVPVTVPGSSQTGALGPALLSGVFDATHDAGVRWVNTDQRFLDQRRKELDLQEQGRLDPSTPIRDELLTPNTRVEGEVSLDGGHATGEIRLVDPATGDVIARIPIDREFDRDSLDDLRKLLGDLGDEIIRRLLDLLPTTTTTTSTTSTTTTTTVPPTTTSTTSTTTTTVATLPGTTAAPTTTTTTLVSCGAGLVSWAEVFYDVAASAQAESGGLSDPHAWDTGPQTVEYGPAGGSDAKPYTLAAARGGATAAATGTVAWSVGGCQITGSGTFHEESLGGSATAVAGTALDARLQVSVRVSQQTPYTVTGSVRASGDASGASPASAYLECTGHFGEANGTLQAPTGVAVPFGETSTAYSGVGNELTILCAVIRGGASADGTGDDAADLEWTWTLTLGS